MKLYIGIDLGGTNIRVGAMDEKEDIVFEYQGKTYDKVNNIDDLYKKIVNLIKKVPNYEVAEKIGIALPGSINKDSKVVTSKNVSMLIDYPLKEKLTKEFNKEIIIENDAKVAALAESIKKKAKNYNIVCYVTISTGLGGGIIINKKIYQGSNNFGGYIPRIILDENMASDALISGRVLLEKAKEIDSNIKSNKELFDLYKNNNSSAIKIINDFKHYLVVLLINLCATFNPDIIVIGGGVMKSSSYFLDDVKKDFYNKIHPLAKDTIIEKVSLKEPGIIGACLLAKYN